MIPVQKWCENIREWGENIWWGMIPVQKWCENIWEWGKNIYWDIVFVQKQGENIREQGENIYWGMIPVREQGKIIRGCIAPVRKRSKIIRKWCENIWSSMAPVPERDEIVIRNGFQINLKLSPSSTSPLLKASLLMPGSLIFNFEGNRNEPAGPDQGDNKQLLNGFLLFRNILIYGFILFHYNCIGI